MVCSTPRDAGANRPIGWPLQGPACHSCPVRKATEDKENPDSRSLCLGPAQGSQSASLFASKSDGTLVRHKPTSRTAQGVFPSRHADSGTPPFQRRCSAEGPFPPPAPHRW